MELIRHGCRALVLFALALYLCGCIEVEERYRISRDGKADARVVIKVDPQYESLVLPELEKKIREEPPTGMKIDSSQRIDGKAAILLEGEGLDLATISASEFPMQLIVSSAGFLKKRYLFSVNVTKRLEIPVPHRLRVTLPGTIEQTNGKKIDSDTVEFDLTNARRGARYQASSDAFGLSFLSGGSGAAATAPTAVGGSSNSNAATPAWLVPASLGAIILGAVLLTVHWFRRARAASVPVALATQDAVAAARTGGAIGGSVDVPPQAQIFCSECGAQQSAARRFCSQCGTVLA